VTYSDTRLFSKLENCIVYSLLQVLIVICNTTNVILSLIYKHLLDNFSIPGLDAANYGIGEFGRDCNRYALHSIEHCMVMIYVILNFVYGFVKFVLYLV